MCFVGAMAVFSFPFNNIYLRMGRGRASGEDCGPEVAGSRSRAGESQQISLFHAELLDDEGALEGHGDDFVQLDTPTIENARLRTQQFIPLATVSFQSSEAGRRGSSAV